MRTFTAISLTLASASVVLAQSTTSTSSSASASSTPSSITLPAGISNSCSSFLTQLNSDSTMQSCLNGLVTATSDFDPTTSSSTGNNATAISDALTNICSANLNSLCDPSVVRNNLANFYSSCGNDMVPADGSAGNQDVIQMYDTLYLIVPLRNALCSKDPSNGNYCIYEMNNSTSSSQKRDLSLTKRADNGTSQTTLQTPDMDSYRESGLPYLFITPNSSTTILCSECTGRIVGSYVAFETVTPYALGIPNSKVLSGQVALWNKIQQCSNGLANEILNNSTGNTGTMSGGATDVRVGMTGIVVALMSALVATAAMF